MMKNVLLLLAAGLFILTCNDRTIEEVDIDFGYDYFPLEVGKYLIYQADSVIYDPAVNGTIIDTTSTFVREAIIDTTTDETGTVWYIVERSERVNTSDPWVLKRLLRLSSDPEKAIRNEDNLSFISLVFPVEENVQWDGNQFFDPGLIISVAGESIEMYKSWGYEIQSVGNTYTLDDQTFPDVVEVSMADNENLIERRFAHEVYAKDIGLIYREMLILDTQCETCCNGDFASCEAIDWEVKAEKGFVLRQRLMEHN